MNIVTLISDWGIQDPSVAMMKGRILSRVDCQIVDISHGVEVLSVNQTAFMLGNAYKTFPLGTVHVALTCMSRGAAGQPLAVKVDGQYFIGMDNAVLPLMFSECIGNETVYRYNGDDADYLDKVASLVAACVKGDLEEVADACGDYLCRRPFKAEYFPQRNHLSGHVVYMDSNNNIVTNISEQMFREALGTRNFEGTLGGHVIRKVHASYARDTEPYFLPNTLGMLEIVTYGGRVALLAKWQQDVNIEIDFF